MFMTIGIRAGHSSDMASEFVTGNPYYTPPPYPFLNPNSYHPPPGPYYTPQPLPYYKPPPPYTDPYPLVTGELPEYSTYQHEPHLNLNSPPIIQPYNIHPPLSCFMSPLVTTTEIPLGLIVEQQSEILVLQVFDESPETPMWIFDDTHHQIVDKCNEMIQKLETMGETLADVSKICKEISSKPAVKCDIVSSGEVGSENGVTIESELGVKDYGDGEGEILCYNLHEDEYGKVETLAKSKSKFGSKSREGEIVNSAMALLEDVFVKRGMYLRLLPGIATRRPWFGRWGYKFFQGSFGVTNDNEKGLVSREEISDKAIAFDMNIYSESNKKIETSIYNNSGDDTSFDTEFFQHGVYSKQSESNRKAIFEILSCNSALEFADQLEMTSSMEATNDFSGRVPFDDELGDKVGFADDPEPKWKSSGKDLDLKETAATTLESSVPEKNIEGFKMDVVEVVVEMPSHENMSVFDILLHKKKDDVVIGLPLLSPISHSSLSPLSFLPFREEEAMVMFKVTRVESAPIDGQKPGTSSLRKKVNVFTQPHYLHNFVQSTFNALSADKVKGATLDVSGDGRYYSNNAIQIIIKMAAVNGVRRVWVGQNGLLSTPAVSAIIRVRVGADGSKASGSFILTSSHNPGGPYEDFGIKYNMENGGPAPEGITDKIYENTKTIKEYLIAEGLPDVDISVTGKTNFEGPEGQFDVDVFDSTSDYMKLMKSIFDF